MPGSCIRRYLHPIYHSASGSTHMGIALSGWRQMPREPVQSLTGTSNWPRNMIGPRWQGGGKNGRPRNTTWHWTNHGPAQPASVLTCTMPHLLFTFVSIRNSTHMPVQIRLFSTPRVHVQKRICLKTYWKCGGPSFCELKSPFWHTCRAPLPFTFKNWLTTQKEKTMKILVNYLLYSQLIHYSSKQSAG